MIETKTCAAYNPPPRHFSCCHTMVYCWIPMKSWLQELRRQFFLVSRTSSSWSTSFHFDGISTRESSFKQSASHRRIIVESSLRFDHSSAKSRWIRQKMQLVLALWNQRNDQECEWNSAIEVEHWYQSKELKLLGKVWIQYECTNKEEWSSIWRTLVWFMRRSWIEYCDVSHHDFSNTVLYPVLVMHPTINQCFEHKKTIDDDTTCIWCNSDMEEPKTGRIAKIVILW